jgi:hypothetical protein
MAMSLVLADHTGGPVWDSWVGVTTVVGGLGLTAACVAILLGRDRALALGGLASLGVSLWLGAVTWDDSCLRLSEWLLRPQHNCGGTASNPLVVPFLATGWLGLGLLAAALVLPRRARSGGPTSGLGGPPGE